MKNLLEHEWKYGPHIVGVFEVLDSYINSKTKIKHRCKVCGYEWMVTPGSLISGSDCPVCKGHRRRTHTDYVTELALIHPNLEVMEQYKGQHKKIQHRCKVCGYTWFIELVNLTYTLI